MRKDKLIKLSFAMIDLPTARRAKHFSFILIRNKVVCMGWNIGFKTHPLAHKMGHRYDSIHSELHCIKKFPYPPATLSRCKLFNVRVNRKGKVRLSKPCPFCQKLLGTFNFKEIWYTLDGGEFKQLA
jgi:hypothetical protein